MIPRPDIKVVTKATASKARLHLLPVRIEHSGPAAVRQYLVVQDDATHTVLGDVAAAPFDVGLSTSFRGRLFCGQRRRLPPQCAGVVMRADEQEADAPQQWTVAHAFDELCVWQRERPIADADKINSWLAWPRLAAIVHRPLSPSDIAAASARIAAGEFNRANAVAASDAEASTATTATTTATATATTATTSTPSKRKRDQSPVVSVATASPRRSPRVAKSTPTKRKKPDDDKMLTPATETKAPPQEKMSTPASEGSPTEKRRRVARRLDKSEDD
jgi:hypothetical protein